MYVFGSVWVGSFGGEWVRGLGLGSANPGGTGESRICVCSGCHKHTTSA